MTAIIMSSPEDWNYIGESPTFHNNVTGPDDPEDEPQANRVASHHSTAAYIPDVSITLAWGMVWRENFKEPWVERFPDHQASGEWLDVFFNNALVFRTSYVLVDGGRTLLPLPQYTRDNTLHVTGGACTLIQLIDALSNVERSSSDTYKSDVKRAGIRIVDKLWPDFPVKPSLSEPRGSRPV